jgi:hypothetical protein
MTRTVDGDRERKAIRHTVSTSQAEGQRILSGLVRSKAADSEKRVVIPCLPRPCVIR